MHLLTQVLDGADQKAAGAGGGVEHHFAQLRVDHVHHELSDSAWRVELARIAGALQVLEDLFVQIVELVAFGLAIEIDAIELVDYLAQKVAAFHVVVGVFEHAADHVATRVAHRVGAQLFELGEELVVHKVEQGLAGHALGVCGPVAPAQVFGNRAVVTVAREFKLFFQGVEDLEEQQPGELADALGVAVDADVLAHDVLDGFDDGGEVGHGTRDQKGNTSWRGKARRTRRSGVRVSDGHDQVEGGVAYSSRARVCRALRYWGRPPKLRTSSVGVPSSVKG
ncbi:hypothetical protein FQZ97_736350 [compost metagenome]